MSIVRLEALNLLRDAIVAGVPELREKIEVVQVPPEQRVTFPKLAIVPGGFRRVSQTEEEQSKPTTSTLCVCVGYWDVTVQLRLAHATLGQRYALTEKISNVFDQRENAPGSLVTRVVKCADVGPFFAAWDVDEQDWQDDMAFSSQHWSVSTLTGTIPILVIRNGVYNLDHLYLGISHDFSIGTTAQTFDAMTNLVEINADGTVTPVTRS